MLPACYTDITFNQTDESFSTPLAKSLNARI